MGLPTAERIREAFNYNPDTGAITWRIRAARNTKIGAVAGWRIPDGYSRVNLDKMTLSGSHVAWVYMTGKWPDEMIDHIDGDPTNDRFANLREATNGQNQCNAKRRCSNTSGMKGVCRNKNSWMALIAVNKKRHYLGTFPTREQAFEAYSAAAKEMHGEYARLE